MISCSSTVWDRPAAEVKAEIVAGKTEFLFSLKSSVLAESDLGPLGSGAAWNLGTIFWNADRDSEAELLWKRSLNSDGNPWREQAGRDLFDLYSTRRDWPKAEAIALKLVGFDGGRPEFQRRLFEAYYFQKKDDQAWAILRNWKPGTFSEAEELENQLFRGVLSTRDGKAEEASQALRDLVFDREASVLHFRLESFFQEDESRYELLGPGGREAVAFQALVYRGVAKDLQAWMKGRKFPEGFWNHRALVAGLETIYKAESRAETGLRLLAACGPVTGEAAFAVEYARGRFYRSLNWWPQARASFQKALAMAPPGEDKKKTAWNWLNAWVQINPEGALGPFLQVYSSTDDPEFFTDVFDGWVTELVQGRHWDLLAAVVRDLGHLLTPGDRATAGFILARLAAHGLVDLEKAGVTAAPSELLEESIKVQPYSYEALMARAALGRPLDWPNPDEPGPEFKTDDRGRDRVKLWESMVGFGLEKRVAAEVIASSEPLDPAFVDRTVEVLQARGSWRPSLQILYRLLKEPGQILTETRARRLYPKAYEDLVADRAKAEKLEVSLLLGLMREESSFDAQAKSWVGAQGLTQLMPATAAETAKSLRMKTYDLAKPADNIKIGARFLSTMVRSQGRIYLALMAYNAGGGRIKPWKASMGKLPEEIFVEAAPIAETRGYVKKILTSTVMTGVLHYGKSLDEMVKLIYPGFAP